MIPLSTTINLTLGLSTSIFGEAEDIYNYKLITVGVSNTADSRTIKLHGGCSRV